MLITRTSMFSGKTRTIDLPITQEEIRRWHDGEKIRNVWPHLSPDQREFLKTGATKEEWDETFNGKEV